MPNKLIEILDFYKIKIENRTLETLLDCIDAVAKGRGSNFCGLLNAVANKHNTSVLAIRSTLDRIIQHINRAPAKACDILGCEKQKLTAKSFVFLLAGRKLKGSETEPAMNYELRKILKGWRWQYKGKDIGRAK